MKKFLAIFAVILCLCALCSVAVSAAETKTAYPHGDFNKDGKIDMQDVVHFMGWVNFPYLGIYDIEWEHGLTYVEATPATCTEDGNIAYWHCEKCDKYFADAEGENEIYSGNVIIPTTGHTEIVDVDVAPTCTENGLTEGKHCSVCGEIIVAQENIDALGHNFEKTYTTNETEHWRKCSRCDALKDKAVHTWDNGVVTTPATETTSGVMTYTCTVCGVTKTETIPATGNTGDTYTREGDYIYFGSYPQSEVKDSGLKSTLNSKAGTPGSIADGWVSYGYYDAGSVSDYMWYIDVTEDGDQYRGVYFTSYRQIWTSNSSSADFSNQDENGYYTGNVYWFKYEPLKWRIISESNGTALILCESIIDSQHYYRTDSNRTIDENTIYANNYEYSDIRAWLNETFYEAAFNDLQKALIETTTVDSSARSTNPNNNANTFNSGDNTYACNNTQDKIFLLSEQEVTNSSYGFSSDYAYKDTVRRKQNTDYAKSQGCGTSISTDYAGNGYWWLRSPHYIYSDCACPVIYDGRACGTDYVGGTSGGVVPALQIRF